MASEKKKEPSRWQRGFSLIELICVMVLLGIIAGVAAPATGRFLDSLGFRRQTAELMAAVRYARLVSVGRGKPVEMRFDPASKVFAFRGAVSEVREVALQDDGSFEFSPEILVFYPDGLATPARLVSKSGRRSREFVVDPLTGIPGAEKEE